jgi:hypothetical protein
MSENFDFQNEEQKPLTPEQREADLRANQKNQVDEILKGVNDTFEKTYTEFEALGWGKEVKVAVKAPNVVEIGKIAARHAAYLNGMNNYASEYLTVAFQMLATLRITGVIVPEKLKNDDEIYNLDPLYTIGRDFQRWLGNFRN